MRLRNYLQLTSLDLDMNHGSSQYEKEKNTTSLCIVGLRELYRPTSHYISWRSLSMDMCLLLLGEMMTNTVMGLALWGLVTMFLSKNYTQIRQDEITSFPMYKVLTNKAHMQFMCPFMSLGCMTLDSLSYKLSVEGQRSAPA